MNLRVQSTGHRVQSVVVRHVFVACLAAFIAVAFLIAGPCAAAAVSSKELIENAKALDGKTIRYRGEAVTAIMNRPEGSWINLNDGDNAIGVWCKSAMLDPVKFIGDYKSKGDILEVEGVFNRACPAHGGELDIHAIAVNVVKHGFMVKEKIDAIKLDIAIAVFLIAILLSALFKKRL